MLPYFPKMFSNKAISTYIVSLTVVLLAFPYKMIWYMYVFAIVGVYVFFHYSSTLSREWSFHTQKWQERKLFGASLWIRVIYVCFSYFFYTSVTGGPFDLNAFDSAAYHDTAMDLAHDIFPLKFLVSVSALDDVGYPFYLSLVYRLTGDSILIARLIKAVLSSLTVLCIFKYCVRNFDSGTALIAGCFCMLMPNLIWYCGVHNKETEMLFLTVLFIERADYILKTQKLELSAIMLLVLSCAGVFFFREVLSYALILSFMAAGTIRSDRVGKKFKMVSAGFIVVCLVFAGLYESFSDSIDTEQYINLRDKQNQNMAWRSERGGGNYLAKYAGAAVFAPMIFTLPFPTMVGVDGQENQQMMHCGYFVRNILSGFTILALLILLRTREWRRHVLSLSFMIGYMVILIFSNFAQSERFHIPILPFVLMYAAYGVTHIRIRQIKLYDLWNILILFVCFGWQWFKLKGRGMI